MDKAQAHTIDHVIVDCYNFWHCGQLGVAVGRASNVEGLQVENFNIFAATLKHPDRVHNFYSQPGKPLKMDRSCCQQELPNIQVNVFPTVHFGANLPNTASSDPEPGPSASKGHRQMLEENVNKDECSIQLDFPFDLDDFMSGELLEPITKIQEV